MGSAPKSALSGPITAFGVYGDNGGSGTGNRRIDTFTIEAVSKTAIMQPKFNAVNLQGGNVVMKGAGTPSGSWHLLASTNLTSASSSWSSVATGTFDASGNVSLTNAVNSSVRQQFYRLQAP